MHKSQHFSGLLLLPPKCSNAEPTHCYAFCPKFPYVTREMHRKDQLEGAKQLLLIVYYSFAAPILSTYDFSTKQYTN